MVGLVLVAHSRELAAALARFAKQAAAAPVPVACAAGVGDAGATELGTDAQAIAEAIRSVHGPDGVLVLMDLGSAVLSAETALELLPEEVRVGVRLCPAPLVEGAVAAAVQSAQGGSLESVFREASLALAPKADHLVAPAACGQLPTPAEAIGEVFQEVEATLLNAHGLHLRPAARLVRTAARFRAEVQVGRPGSGRPPVSAASLNSVSTLGVGQGERIVFRARGPDACEALEALRRLAEERFGEPSAPAAEPLPQAPPPKTGEGPGLVQGVPVSEGFAAAPVLVLARAPLAPSNRIPLIPEEEWAALQDALGRERASLERERRELADRLGPERGALFEAFQLVLEDPALLGPAREEIFAERLNAEQALDTGIRTLAGRFRDLPDAYARQRAADILDLGQRVLHRLRGEAGEPGFPAAAAPAGPVLLAAEELPPTAAARLEPRAVLGVLTVRGGPTSHASVLIRSLGIPCITGLPESLLRLPAGTVAAMDGGEGRVWIEPDAPTLGRIEAYRTAWLRRRSEAAASSQQPAVSRDGRRYWVEANIAGVAEAEQAVAQGCEGVGVLRTEFLFLRRTDPPGEDEQLEALRRIAEALRGRPLTVRTLDIGGDKEAPYLSLPVEPNPYLGVRGVRLCLRRPELFRSQLRAVLRAAERHDVRLLFPMITTREELDGAVAELDRARDELAREGVPHRWPVPVGMMVETPSAALSIDTFLERVDFVSIGTNDLTQYTLAAERGNPALAGYEDALHPAVLTLIRQVAEAASRLGRTAAVCGEIAGDPAALPVLAGLGVRCFSLNPNGIPRVKETLRRLNAEAAAGWAHELLGCRTAAEVRRRATAYYAALSSA
jgi:phosphoenolpyruvate-protein phosphotransferase/dihydroxyacetone kinase phosphotransfer subunit